MIVGVIIRCEYLIQRGIEMSEAVSRNTKRIYKWDNLKCFLIVMVVIGHFVNQYAPISNTMKSLSLFIYSFHMPLFIFLSGLLQKKWNDRCPFRWDKIIYYIMIGYVLKFCIYGIKILFHQEAVFHWFEDTGIPWYMFAMAAFMIIAYLVKDLPVWFVLPISIMVACLAGYDEKIGSFLYLSRILVFFPFYYTGYCLDIKKLQEVLNKTWIKCLSAIFLTDMILYTLAKIEDNYSYIRLFTGRNAYSLINVESCGAVHRLMFYVIAFLMGIAIISLIPNCKVPVVGTVGARTLQIYFWHRLILYVLTFSGITGKLIKNVPSGWVWIYLAMAIILPFVLSAEVFSVPLTLLKNGENIILAGIEKLSINFYKWKESTLTVLPVLEFITIVLMLIYYGEDVGIL